MTFKRSYVIYFRLVCLLLTAATVRLELAQNECPTHPLILHNYYLRSLLLPFFGFPSPEPIVQFVYFSLIMNVPYPGNCRFHSKASCRALDASRRDIRLVACHPVKDSVDKCELLHRCASSGDARPLNTVRPMRKSS